MTVNRKLLEQELARAGQITQSAVSGEGFDPRGGYGVLAAQLGTAAIGAFAQKRAKDKILAQEEQRNIALSKVTGLGLDLVSQLSDSSKQSAMDLALKSRFSQPEQPKAMRDASKTGGALGQISEKELDLLEKSMGAVDPSLPDKQFRRNMKEVKLEV
jgi:hypothetical protein